MQSADTTNLASLSVFELIINLKDAASKNAIEQVNATADALKTAINTATEELLAVTLSEKNKGDELPRETGLYELMVALNRAAQKNSIENVKVIVNVVMQVIDKCPEGQLVAGLSAKNTFGAPLGQTGINCLMNALHFAAGKNSIENVKAIADVAMQLIINRPALLAGLSEKVTAGSASGITGLYDLMCALQNAAERKSSENISAIANVAKVVIEQCPADKLGIGLSEKKIGSVRLGETGLFWLMIALYNVTEDNSIENINTIAEVTKAVIKNCPADKLGVGLSEKLAAGGVGEGTTGLYWLVNALQEAVSKNLPANVSIIAEVAKAIIIKCPADTLSSGLFEKQIGWYRESGTGFYKLMGSLEDAISKGQHDNVKLIAEVAKAIIEKCPADKLSAGLPEKITADKVDDTASLSKLMAALQKALIKKSIEDVTVIADVLMAVIVKYPDSQLGIAFSQKTTVNNYSDITLLCFLIGLLKDGVINNAIENIKVIKNIIETVIRRCPEDQLVIGLSYGYNWAPNALFAMMNVFEVANVKNLTETVTLIADIIKQLIDKCSADQLVNKFLEKSIADNKMVGTTGFWCLIHSLHIAACEKTTGNVKAIANSVMPLIDACSSDQLRAGFADIKIKGEDEGRSALYFLMDAIEKATSNNMSENVAIISHIIFKAIRKLDKAKMSDEQKKLIFDRKKVLQQPLYDYLTQQIKIMSVTDFEKMCGPSTLLGELIDSRRLLEFGVTDRRNWVNALIEKTKRDAVVEASQKKQEGGNGVVSALPPIEAFLADLFPAPVSMPAPIQPIALASELPPPSYEQVVAMRMGREKRRAKIALLRATEMLLEKLQNSTDFTGEFAAFNEAKAHWLQKNVDSDSDAEMNDILLNVQIKINAATQLLLAQYRSAPSPQFFASARSVTETEETSAVKHQSSFLEELDAIGLRLKLADCKIPSHAPSSPESLQRGLVSN